eukprot:5967908-Amphidinium_carterae.1
MHCRLHSSRRSLSKVPVALFRGASGLPSGANRGTLVRPRSSVQRGTHPWANLRVGPGFQSLFGGGFRPVEASSFCQRLLSVLGAAPVAPGRRNLSQKVLQRCPGVPPGSPRAHTGVN